MTLCLERQREALEQLAVNCGGGLCVFACGGAPSSRRPHPNPTPRAV